MLHERARILKCPTNSIALMSCYDPTQLVLVNGISNIRSEEQEQEVLGLQYCFDNHQYTMDSLTCFTPFFVFNSWVNLLISSASPFTAIASRQSRSLR